MVRYKKLNESIDVQQHMRFYDRFHNILPNIIELDPDQYDGEPNAKRYNPVTKSVEDCYYPDGIVELDTVVNPSVDHMESFRRLRKLKHFHTIPPDERRALIGELTKHGVRQERLAKDKEEESTTD